MKAIKNYLFYKLFFILTVFGQNNPLRNKLRKKLGNGHLTSHIQGIYATILMVIVSYTHPRVRIKWPGSDLKDAPEIANVAQSIHDKCAASSWLAGVIDLATILSTLQGLIDDLVTKAAKAEGGSKTDKTNLEDAINVMQTSGTLDIINIIQAKVYANKDSAQAIVDSCGVFLKLAGGRDAQVWSVKRIAQGSVELSGQVKGIRSRYTAQWQRTLDPDNIDSWYERANEIIPTTTGKTIITGLPLGREVFFRYRIIIAGEPGDWSDVISLFVS